MLEQRLLNAFETSLVEHGWNNTTLVRVAEIAQASRMTLHRHGITKESLLEVLSERLNTEHRDALWPAMTGEGTGFERLAAILRAECALTEKNLALLQALDTAEHATLYHEESPSGSRATYISPYERVLRDGITDGTIRPIDNITDTATVIFNSVGLTYRHLRSGHHWSAKRCSKLLIDMTLAGLRPDL